MPGHIKHFQANASVLNYVAFADENVSRRAGDGLTEQGTEILPRISQKPRLTHARDKRRRGKNLLQDRVAADVVAMPVGVQHGGRDEFMVAKEIENQLRFQSRVDDQSVAPSSVPD